jgi:hypothetical protein
MTAPSDPVPGNLDRQHPEYLDVTDPNSKKPDDPAPDSGPWMIHSDPEARRERVEQLRREIAAGVYEIPSTEIADAIIRFFDRRSDT